MSYKRLSHGRFSWWPTAGTSSVTLSAWELTVLLGNGHPDRAQLAPDWRPVPLRGHKGGLIIPRQPGTGSGEHLLAVFLHRHQRVQGIHPGLHAGRNDTGEDTRNVGTMLGGIEQGVLALANRQFERALCAIIIERCPGSFTNWVKVSQCSSI